MAENALNDFIFYSKYARYIPSLGRKETFKESVDRVFDMHWEHIENNYSHALQDPWFNNMLIKAQHESKRELIFGSQRSLQFGGDKILKTNAKIYNCSYSYCDRPEFFKELLWILLCGCGVGCSVHTDHVSKLPLINSPLRDVHTVHIVDDSIEGWALAVDELVNSYFTPIKQSVTFDYSQIRPKGALISGGFIAPGPDGLRNSIELIRKIFDKAIGRKLTPFDCFSINCHLADSVLSGGVRRSALSTLFDPNDESMRNAKTGNWFIENPHFARSNNSMLLTREDGNYETFSKNFDSAKEFGEPGFAFVNDINVGYNPCFEIAMSPILDSGLTGWLFCNLTTMSGKKINTDEDFYKACELSAFVGTIQASYNQFPFLGKTTEELVKRDSLLGVSISGIMMNCEVLLNPDTLQTGAQIVKDINKRTAEILGINPAKRTTCVKPDGNFSSMTGNTPGCHAAHSKRYIRRVQVNKDEESGMIYQNYNPVSISESVWSNNGTDNVISFPVELPDKTMFKKDLDAIQHLEIVKLIQENWVKAGNREPESNIEHNVSVTVLVNDNEWDAVKEYIWDNRQSYSGISLLPKSGDLIYNQAAYSEVLLPDELLNTYGHGIMFASGLIVDILNTFGDLWKACDTVSGIGENLYSNDSDVCKFLQSENIVLPSDYENLPFKQVIEMQSACKEALKPVLIKLGYPERLAEYLSKLDDFDILKDEIKKYLDMKLFDSVSNLAAKRDIVRRVHKFSAKYFSNDLNLTLNALKHVNLYHDWCALTSNQVQVDWESITWKNVEGINVDTLAGASCAGGACEITKI